MRSIDWKGERLGILEMRRHYSNYFRGLPGSKHFRLLLVTSDAVGEIQEVLGQIENRYSGLSLKAA